MGEPCPEHGFVRCATSGGTECVDVMTTLDSCGGCYEAGGLDCSVIAHTEHVRCWEGQCIIDRCLAGYVHTKDGRSCEKAFKNAV